MSNKSEIKRYLSVIRRAADLIEDLLEEEDEDFDLEELLPRRRKKKEKPKKVARPKRVQVVEVEEEEPEGEVEPEPVALPPKKVVPHQHTPTPVTAPPVHVNEVQVQARRKHLEELLAIDVWPEAIPKHLEASPTVEDQINRANAMLDMMVTRPTEGVNFLDFGCGDGWVAKQILDRGAASSTGFDLLPSDYWKKDGGVRFTNVFRDLEKHGYDMVMLYDVLDHCEDPMQVMKQVRSLVTDGGIVYVRCHPWTSKHATHLYKQGLNKAYIHLFMTWEELVEIGYTPMFTRAEKKPIEAYQWWFKANGFNIEREHIHQDSVHEFFHVPEFKELLAAEQQLGADAFGPFFKAMQIDFVDFQLSPK